MVLWSYDRLLFTTISLCTWYSTYRYVFIFFSSMVLSKHLVSRPFIKQITLPYQEVNIGRALTHSMVLQSSKPSWRHKTLNITTTGFLSWFPAKILSKFHVYTANRRVSTSKVLFLFMVYCVQCTISKPHFPFLTQLVPWLNVT